MYKNSQVIFREYIQNSCDAIDKAVELGILQPEEGQIEIWTDLYARNISIEDNGTGITKAEFENILKSIAQSNKQIDSEKGFRGIGRLCGLAYCKELIFSSTVKGEDCTSIMKIDAQKLRSRFYSNKKFTAEEVLNDVITIKEESAEIEDHAFKVELININVENDTLLDEEKVKDYLSFVAPVEYSNRLLFQTMIYKHAETLNFKIDEYKIKLNGKELVKQYKTHFKTSQGEDEIFDLAFKDFYDESGNLIAWLWFGLSSFKGVIESSNKNPNNRMRSIRLRKDNIQIGNEDALQHLFKEDRGIHYFIGEVFAVDKNLIPNSQRNYFIENPVRKYFEDELKIYFEELYKIYYRASEINSANKAIEKRKTFSEEFERKQQNNLFLKEEHMTKDKLELEKLDKVATIKNDLIERRREEALADPENNLSKVIVRLTVKKEFKPEPPAPITPIKPKIKNNKLKYRSQNLSKLDKRQQKLVQTIYDVIDNNPNLSGEKLIDKIEEALR